MKPDVDELASTMNKLRRLRFTAVATLATYPLAYNKQVIKR